MPRSGTSAPCARSRSRARGVHAPGAGGRESVYQIGRPTTRAAGAYDADGSADGAADATLLRAGGVGHVSGVTTAPSDYGRWDRGALSDGYPRGEDTGVFLGVRARARARARRRRVSGGGRRARGGASPSSPPRRTTLSRRGRRDDAGDAGRRGLGRARGGGGADPRRAPYRSTRGSTAARRSRRSRTRTGETIAGSAERGLGRAAVEPLAAADATGAPRGNWVSVPRWRDAGWAPVRMHRPPHARPPRARGGTRGGEAGERVPRREPDMRDAAGMGERTTRKLRESEKVLVMCCKIISVLRYFVRAAH